MPPKKNKKSGLELLIAKYKDKYGTSKIGYRKCQYKLSKECLGEAPDKQFKGLLCKSCLKIRQQQFYQKRKEEAAKDIVEMSVSKAKELKQSVDMLVQMTESKAKLDDMLTQLDIITEQQLDIITRQREELKGCLQFEAWEQDMLESIQNQDGRCQEMLEYYEKLKLSGVDCTEVMSFLKSAIEDGEKLRAKKEMTQILKDIEVAVDKTLNLREDYFAYWEEFVLLVRKSNEVFHEAMRKDFELEGLKYQLNFETHKKAKKQELEKKLKGVKSEMERLTHKLFTNCSRHEKLTQELLDLREEMSISKKVRMDLNPKFSGLCKLIRKLAVKAADDDDEEDDYVKYDANLKGLDAVYRNFDIYKKECESRSKFDMLIHQAGKIQLKVSKLEQKLLKHSGKVERKKLIAELELAKEKRQKMAKSCAIQFNRGNKLAKIEKKYEKVSTQYFKEANNEFFFIYRKRVLNEWFDYLEPNM